MKDLTSGLSQMDLNQSQPTPPAHHVPVEEPTRPPRAKDPPARPPPPQISSESSAPPPPTPSATKPYSGAPKTHSKK